MVKDIHIFCDDLINQVFDLGSFLRKKVLLMKNIPVLKLLSKDPL